MATYNYSCKKCGEFVEDSNVKIKGGILCDDCENEIKQKVEVELKMSRFICPNCGNEVEWVNNPYGSFDGVCTKCWQRWQGFKR